MRRATQSDVTTLVDLMSEYYRESDLYIDVGRAGWTFSQLLSDPKTGRVWLIEADGQVVGYAVLTFAFSIAAGGVTAFVDDLFVRMPFRRKGLGLASLEAAVETCRGLGVRTLNFEVPGHNPMAEGLCRKVGFREDGRSVRTLQLEPPVHQ